MQINTLKRKTKNKKTLKVGRGGKRGKTAGRGTKGQLARSGRKLRPELRDIIKKLPKLRGRGKNSFVSYEIKPAIVNLSDIEARFSNGDTVSPATLGIKGKVKILGSGELTKKVNVQGCTISKGAQEAIEKAGGTVKSS